jgi:hypothetical protein
MNAKYLWILTTALVTSTASRAIMLQQGYLKASTIASADNFGFNVSISGSTMVVGAQSEDSGGFNSGAAYVFVRTGTNWTQQAYLKASNAGPGDQFGTAVSISGDTLVVGANREDSSATGVNGDGANDNIVDSGAAYVFVRNGTNWTQQAYLKPSNPGANDQFGFSVALSGDTVVVGARFEDSRFPGVETDNSLADSGAAYVFTRTGTNWSQQAYLKPLNPGMNFNFGWSVSVSSNTVVVGTPFESSTAVASGAVYVFVRSGSYWTQQAFLKKPAALAVEQLGASVSVWGDTLIAGANRESSRATNSGAACVFARAGTNWSIQTTLKASNPGPEDQFGWFVGISMDTAVVGAKLEDSYAQGINGDESDDSLPESGAAYVFVRVGTNWLRQAYLKASNTGSGDQFGFSVAVSGDTVVIGSPAESSATGDPDDDNAFGSGAAYVFTGFAPPPPLSITLTNGNAQLAWPLLAADFALETASALDDSPATSWTEVPPPYQTNGAQILVSVPAPTGNKFYRLRK